MPQAQPDAQVARGVEVVNMRDAQMPSMLAAFRRPRASRSVGTNRRCQLCSICSIRPDRLRRASSRIVCLPMLVVDQDRYLLDLSSNRFLNAGSNGSSSMRDLDAVLSSSASAVWARKSILTRSSSLDRQQLPKRRLHPLQFWTDEHIRPDRVVDAALGLAIRDAASHTSSRIPSPLPRGCAWPRARRQPHRRACCSCRR